MNKINCTLQKPFYANNKFEESVTVENKANHIVLINWENLHWNNPVEFLEEGMQSAAQPQYQA